MVNLRRNKQLLVLMVTLELVVVCNAQLAVILDPGLSPILILLLRIVMVTIWFRDGLVLVVTMPLP